MMHVVNEYMILSFELFERKHQTYLLLNWISNSQNFITLINS